MENQQRVRSPHGPERLGPPGAASDGQEGEYSTACCCETARDRCRSWGCLSNRSAGHLQCGRSRTSRIQQ